MTAQRTSDHPVWPWNVGKGDERQRIVALLYTAMDHPNVITRQVCLEILADKLLRASK